MYPDVALPALEFPEPHEAARPPAAVVIRRSRLFSEERIERRWRPSVNYHRPSRARIIAGLSGFLTPPLAKYAVIPVAWRPRAPSPPASWRRSATTISARRAPSGSAGVSLYRWRHRTAGSWSASGRGRRSRRRIGRTPAHSSTSWVSVSFTGSSIRLGRRSRHHHRSPAVAMKPAGQDPIRAKPMLRTWTVTLPLQAKSSPFSD
jgi:hypothetical protein